MKVLWSPWRIRYILSKKPKHCIFCEIEAEDKDRDNLILYRAKECFVVMNLYPYTGGHLMVVPYFHTSTLQGLSPGLLSEMMVLAQFSTDCIRTVMRPEGFNVGLNIGQAAGAGIEEHLHLHVVPRWTGDSNFIAPIAETRVIPERLSETYDKLKKVFDQNAQKTES